MESVGRGLDENPLRKGGNKEEQQLQHKGSKGQIAEMQSDRQR